MASPTTESAERGLVTRRSRTGALLGVQTLATGSFTPDLEIRNEDLASLGYDADWIVQRTGILARRHAPAGMTTGDLAVEAAQQCIQQSGVDPKQIDLVLLGTCTPDMPMPATASVVQQRLGLDAMAFDLQAACASFVFALITGVQYVATGCSRLALVIGADCNSRIVNPADVRTYPLFGDAGGAVLLAPGSKEQGLLAYAVGSDGSGADLLCRPMGGAKLPFAQATGPDDPRQYLYMEGRLIYKWAIRQLAQTTADVLQQARMSLQDIDLIIFHQANMRIINSAVKELGLDPAKVFNNLDRYGNTASASIPLALDEAYRQGRIQPGNVILFSGFGAGLAWGTVLIRW